MKLLYVDDDRVNALLFEEVCRVAGGVEVTTAGSGAEALEAARDVAPEALVIDLHLPDANGFDLLHRLRALPGLAEVPALLCSADDPRELQSAAQAAGFAGCWAKPIDVVQLQRELRKLAQPR